MDLKLSGKRAIVTGGSRGIGRAIARQLALEGVRVAIAARDGEILMAAAADLAAETASEIIAVSVDTRSDASVKALMSQVAGAFGGIDILVNAAAKPGGQAPPPKLSEVTDALFWEDVDTKVLGYLRTAREAAPYMIEARWGRIINISGLAARTTGSIVGSIRNVAVAALTKNLADELGPRGVNVTVVHPGLTRTEKTPEALARLAADSGSTSDAVERRFASGVSIGRIVEADEVADVVAFLASPRSVSINGDAIACGGGSRGSIHY
jgi:NAD(P)-dependent dehydrogenase (short-subunit alcohol dehydrogenase family)